MPGTALKSGLPKNALPKNALPKNALPKNATAPPPRDLGGGAGLWGEACGARLTQGLFASPQAEGCVRARPRLLFGLRFRPHVDGPLVEQGPLPCGHDGDRPGGGLLDSPPPAA